MRAIVQSKEVQTQTQAGAFGLGRLAGASRLAAAAAACAALCACAPRPEVVEVKPNETAFLIALGDSTAQKQFMSEEYLAKNQVAAKTVVIPYALVPGGGVTQYVPAAKLIKVDRAPVTREWTRSEKTGTSASNQAIAVESRESIDFTIGVVLTASVPEAWAPKFLYHYAGAPLSQVADGNIRGFVQAALAREFGSRDLDQARVDKAAIFDKVFKEAKEAFAAKGVSIDTLGYSEGMTYTDPAIQRAINEKFEAQMSVQKAQLKVEEARQQRLAAEEFAKAKDAQSAFVDVEIRRTLANAQAQAMVLAAQRWDGQQRASVLPAGAMLNFGLDSQSYAPRAK